MSIRIAAFALFSFLWAGTSYSQDLSPEEVKRLAIEAILENPEVVMQAIEILRENEETAKSELAQTTITKIKDDLFSAENAPVLGNPDGDVTVVEFFDYNCPYCKEAYAEVNKLLDADPNVRLIYREWPILGEASVYAARAALASREQGKYDELHSALMEERGRKTQAVVLRVAEKVGLDIEKLKTDMDGDLVNDHLSKSSQMARKIGFTGTPSFVVGDEGVFGMIPADDLIEFVAEKRAQLSEEN